MHTADRFSKFVLHDFLRHIFLTNFVIIDPDISENPVHLRYKLMSLQRKLCLPPSRINSTNFEVTLLIYEHFEVFFLIFSLINL